MLYYTVRCTFTGKEREDVSERWVDWLRKTHIAEVIAGGASGADIVQMDSEKNQVVYEIRYRFRDRETFDAYEQNHAPRLREDGLNEFPLDLGLSYSRTTGEVVYLH